MKMSWSEECERYEKGRIAARERRWIYPGKATVTHPKYGKVVVPCPSKLAAILNAAEFWKCDELEIFDATVMVWKEGDGPCRRPRDIAEKMKRESENHEN